VASGDMTTTMGFLFSGARPGPDSTTPRSVPGRWMECERV
jgi:hypothetical protein